MTTKRAKADNFFSGDVGVGTDSYKRGTIDFNRKLGETTGLRLNELAWSKGWPADKPWVDRFNSGPLGGDAQIADLVLERRCPRAIFFGGPHVARQHEADIQLLERAVTTVTDEAVCIPSPAVAARWVAAARRRASMSA